MEITIDFSDPSEKPRSRGPPPRFASMAKSKESAPAPEPTKKPSDEPGTKHEIDANI